MVLENPQLQAWTRRSGELANTAAKTMGFTKPKPKQEEVVVNFLEDKKVFAVLPTGYRKRLCYMCLPAAYDLLNKTEGSIVVVITPLTGILKDQVKCGRSERYKLEKRRFLITSLMKVSASTLSFSSLLKKISFRNNKTGLHDSVQCTSFFDHWCFQ